MKKIVLFLIVALFANVNILQAKENDKSGYSITITINGWSDTNVFLGNYFGQSQYLKDTAYLDKNGRCVFAGEQMLDPGMYFIVTPGKKYFEIIVDQDQVFSLETDTSNFKETMEFKGSEDNTIFYKYLIFIDAKTEQIKPLQEEYIAIEDKETQKAKDILAEIEIVNTQVADYKIDFMEKYPDHMLSYIFIASKDIEITDIPILENGREDSIYAYHQYLNRYFENIDFSDARILRSPSVYHSRLSNYFENVVPKMPDSIMYYADIIVEQSEVNRDMFKYTLFWLTSHYERSRIMGYDAIFVHLVDTYYATGQAFWVSPKVLQNIVDASARMRPLLIGETCPSLLMYDTLGEMQSLSAIEAEYTILYFWSIDCGHCKTETPALYKFYQENKELGVEVFAVSIDTKEDDWKAMINEKGMTEWTNVNDIYNRSRFRNTFDIIATPVLYVLDKDKKIVAKKLDAKAAGEFILNLMEQDKQSQE